MDKKKVFILSVILFLSFYFYPQAVTYAKDGCESASVKALMEYALSLYRAGDYQDARHEFNKCLMIDPDCSVCSDYLEKLSAVPAAAPREMPVAVLESQKMDECMTFIFDGTKSYDPDGNIVSYEWDFGDGAKGQGPTVIHTYKQTGTYVVRLTVTDDSDLECNKASITQELTVSGAPEIEIEVPPFSCPDTEVVFNAQIKGSGANQDSLEVAWDFGDGTTGKGATASHVYSKGGVYIVKAIVTDTSMASCNTADAEASIKINTSPVAKAGEDIIACFPATQPSSEVRFDGTGSFDAENDALNYHWDFGDGVTSDLARPVHIYRKSGKYKVTLTVSDDPQGPCNVSQDSIDVILNHAPIADAGANKACCLGEQVLFDASGSSDPDGDDLSYTWDFGDGQTAQGKEVTHTYAQPGEYKVVLVVNDNFAHTSCNSSTAEFTARVSQVPVAVMHVKPYYSTEENK